MTALTGAQASADADLRRAVEAYARVFELIDDEEMILDYVTVGVAQGLNDDGQTRMFTCYPGGTTPVYRVLGLLHCAIKGHEDLVNGGEG